LDQEKQDHLDSVQMIYERIDPEGCIHSVGMKPSNTVSMIFNCVDVLLEKIKEQDDRIHCMIISHSEELQYVRNEIEDYHNARMEGTDSAEYQI
jgi:hypothetical protein